MLTQVVESQAQWKPAGVCVLQLLLALLHDGLDDGGGHVAVTRSYGNHTARQCSNSSHLEVTHTVECF